MMKSWKVLTILVVMTVACGCTPEDLAKVDQAATAASDISAAGQGVIHSPAGVWVPEPYRTAAELIMGGVSALTAYWLNRRKNEYKTGLLEFEYAERIFKDTDPIGNKEFDLAKAAALNPSTVKLIKKGCVMLGSPKSIFKILRVAGVKVSFDVEQKALIIKSDDSEQVHYFDDIEEMVNGDE